jgi:hypothetical protein
MGVVNASFDHPLVLEERAAAPLAGGIQQMGFQCGQVWGAALAAGAQAHQLYGPGPQAEAAAVAAAQRLATTFAGAYKSINCSDVTQLDWRNTKTAQLLGYILRGGVVKCFAMTASYARAARADIEANFADSQVVAPEPPISCASLLAEKRGASGLHRAMLAGFAGGIGLSGGACGALGAAIWLIELSKVQEEGRKLVMNRPEAEAAIDAFVERTEIEFECAKIVGRKFADVADHAAYLRAGGCAQIIEALAQQER